MWKKVQNAITAVAVAAVGAVLAVAFMPVAGQAPVYRAPRTASGKPDLNGVWQALNEANYDIQAHTARPAMALRSGPYGLVPAAPGPAAAAELFLQQSPSDRADAFYNNLHQIVQTRDAVMILTEMVHDARIVRMNAQHLPKKIRKWMGDSVGHWEGDTLVVDTTNFTDKTRFRGSSEDLHVIERFSRVDPKTLLYRFTIEDPATWAKAWTGEYTWSATGEHIYEYACHEANYALGDVLRGARLREADEAAKTKK